MAKEKDVRAVTFIDHLAFIPEHETVEVREATNVLDGDKVISKSFHRQVLKKDDPSAQSVLGKYYPVAKAFWEGL